MEDKEKYHSLLVIDDHKIVAHGIKLLLGSRFNHFYMAHDGASGISMALQHFPSMVIVDYSMPDTTGNLVARELKYRQPNIKILAYTFTYTPDVIIKMLQAGINGYVIKTEQDEELVKAIEYIMRGRDYFCKEARNHIINRFASDDDGYEKLIVANTGFSSKELDIIKLLCRQMNAKTISGNVHLSERTVEQYRSNITRRIGAKNLAGIIKFALQNGIVELDEL